jgi:hypothetical protein
VNSQTPTSLPDLFCWTRFGTEAAEPIEQILFRKEQERLANGGLFLWGIGNALGPSMKELTRRVARPEVIFSPIRSAPRAIDVEPPAIVSWTAGEGLDGRFFALPAHSRVTSKFDPSGRKFNHYALVCFSDTPLLPLRNENKIAFIQLRNLRTGRPVGASQVTAVVQTVNEAVAATTMYDVAIRAQLVYPFFVRLLRAIQLPVIHVEVGSPLTSIGLRSSTMSAV